MPQVQSRDGSRIDYDQRGSGPPVILVAGATRIVVVRAITAADDPKAAARALSDALRG